MATPTPSTKQPSGPPTTMTPGSFNHHAAFSPLPAGTSGLRSVPSPAYLGGPHQTKAGKSPFNPSGLHSSPLGTSNPPSNPAINFDSPSAAIALGLNLGSIGTLDGNFIGSSVVGAGQPRSDEERKEKTEQIIAILQTRPGRISEEGVERLTKRVGLDNDWNEEPDGRTLSIAGSTVLIDIGFKSNVVDRVALTLPTASEAVNVHALKGAAILHRDLTAPPGISSINTTLAKFGNNLERLARLDKLSSAELSCYEAISGVYSSLKKISDHEKNAIQQSVTTSSPNASISVDERVELEVLSKRSGRPMMHTGTRVGLSLQYWLERRSVPMNGGGSILAAIDRGTVGDRDTGQTPEVKRQVWSATIECESSPAELYPPIRVSENWVSDKIVKPQDEDQMLAISDSHLTDWIEPSPTVISLLGGQGDIMAVDSGTSNGKLPDIRFLARIEPPVIVPLHTAVEICGIVGISISPESFRPPTFDTLIVPSPASVNTAQQGERKELKRQKTIAIHREKGDTTTRSHKNTLYTQKPDYGRIIDDLPFSHPKQLVSILPTLRQYALLGSILHNSFSLERTTETDSNTPTPKKPTNPNENNVDDELATLLADTQSIATRATDPLPVDVTLSTQPIPRISLVFPLGSEVAHITFEIAQNANITVAEQNILTIIPEVASQTGETRKRLVVEDLRRIFEITEDIGTFIEFLRQRFE